MAALDMDEKSLKKRAAMLEALRQELSTPTGNKPRKVLKTPELYRRWQDGHDGLAARDFKTSLGRLGDGALPYRISTRGGGGPTLAACLIQGR
jgi:hypothetical protein